MSVAACADSSHDDCAVNPRGVASHSTTLLETPELIAERLLRSAAIVGRESVLAGTDYGLGGRVHPQIAWGKLKALVGGAALASREL